jgi:hypothetical protein
MDDESVLEQLANIQVANAGSGLQILDKGRHRSLGNDDSQARFLLPHNVEEIMSILNQRLRERQHARKSINIIPIHQRLGGLFGGENPRKRD